MLRRFLPGLLSLGFAGIGFAHVMALRDGAGLSLFPGGTMYIFSGIDDCVKAAEAKKI